MKNLAIGTKSTKTVAMADLMVPDSVWMSPYTNTLEESIIGIPVDGNHDI